jgi:hypothetical protein
MDEPRAISGVELISSRMLSWRSALHRPVSPTTSAQQTASIIKGDIGNDTNNMHIRIDGASLLDEA